MVREKHPNETNKRRPLFTGYDADQHHYQSYQQHYSNNINHHHQTSSQNSNNNREITSMMTNNNNNNAYNDHQNQSMPNDVGGHSEGQQQASFESSLELKEATPSATQTQATCQQQTKEDGQARRQPEADHNQTDGRDPLAQLISSTIGDIMLDIAPKN